MGGKTIRIPYSYRVTTNQVVIVIIIVRIIGVHIHNAGEFIPLAETNFIITLEVVFRSQEETNLFADQRTANGPDQDVMAIAVGPQEFFAFFGELIRLEIHGKVVIRGTGTDLRTNNTGIGTTKFRGVSTGQYLEFFDGFLNDVNRVGIA